MVTHFRVLAFAVLGAAGLALAACSNEADKADQGPLADPLIYEIAGPDGDVRGWLFGTIHALPKDTHWRTPAIDRAIERAGMLVVEVADLGDRAGISATFGKFATTPGLPPLSQRIAPSLRPGIAALMEQAGLSEHDTTGIETWAAALMLARVRSDGSAANGVDRALIADFEGRRVRELEGARRQLAIFDNLAEADQRDLLREVVAGAGEIGAQPAALRRAWLSGDEPALVEASATGILADPGLREALLVERNRAWLGPILDELDNGERPLIAVGAAHVVGPDGLAALIDAEGYTVMRMR